MGKKVELRVFPKILESCFHYLSEFEHNLPAIPFVFFLKQSFYLKPFEVSEKSLN